MTQHVKTAIAMGGNLGNRLKTFQRARQELQTLGTGFCYSAIYETEPVDSPSNLSFYNAVICFKTILPPLQLLNELLKIENRFGRTRTKRNDARTLDLDILLYGSTRFSHPSLTLPHPRMANRLFTMLPLLEVWPADFTIPGAQMTLQMALKSAQAQDKTSAPKRVYDLNWNLTSLQDTCPHMLHKPEQKPLL